MVTEMVMQPGNRRAVRRAVSLSCAVISRYWDEPVLHDASDLSPFGIWVDSSLPLEPGEPLVVAFTPPRWRLSNEIVAFAQVRRASLSRRRDDAGLSGMGIEFLDVSRAERAALEAVLRGVPPPLPRTLRRARSSIVDVPIVLEEDLGDRVNTITMHVPVGVRDELDLVPSALGALLTGSRRAA